MRPILLLALLAACNGETLDPSQDADGDGFSMDQGDCDDGNTGIFPGATERCDGVDSDCDGDDGGAVLIGAATFYEDADADGFGAEAGSVVACEAPEGTWVEVAGDCAPDDGDRNPGATEVCDDADNNCSGEVDDGLAAVFADVDGDGFGDPGVPLEGCETGDDRAANDDDCDDTDAAITPETVWYFDTDEDGFGVDEITETSCTSPGGDYASEGGDCRPNDPDGYPGAEEICDNGQQPQNIDDNCNGMVDEGCEDLVSCDTIDTDTTWSGDLVIPCDIVVEGTPTPTLTIADGTTVRFGPGRSLTIGRLDNGRLVVEGDVDGVTLTSDEDTPAAGDWAGLVLDNAPGSVLTGLTIANAGADGAGLLMYEDDTVVNGLTLDAIDGIGIDVRGGNPQVSDLTATGVSGAAVDCSLSADIAITNATVSDVGSPMITHLDCADAYRGVLDFSDMDEPYVTVSGLVMSESATWSKLGIPYRLTQGINVAGQDQEAVWTIDHGVEIQVDSGEAVKVGAAGIGSLVAGTSATGEEILFTSSAEVPQPGDWTGIVVQGTLTVATLRNVTVEYAGGDSVFDGSIYMSAGSGQLIGESVEVRDGASNGVNVWSGALLQLDLTISGHAGTGLLVEPFGGIATLNPVTLTNNGEAMRFESANDIHALRDSTVTISGNGDDRIVVADMTLDAPTAVWSNFGVPYLIETSLTAARDGGTDFTIADGTVMQFAEGAQLQIGFAGGQTGTLTANDVTFEGEGDSPGAGFWNGIAVRGDSTITNSTIRHAGNAPSSPIDLFSGVSTVTGNAFEDVSGDAINCWFGSGPNTVSGNIVNGMPYLADCD